MRDKIYYYDHNDKLQLTLNDYPYYSEPADLFDWSWEFEEQFGRINTFRRAKDSYSLVIGIAGNYAARHNALCDIFTADILAGQPGYLMLNGWKLYCYMVETENENVADLNRKATFAVKSINSAWIREQTASYNGTSGESASGDDLGRDYTYIDGLMGRGYNYGYSQPDSHYASIDLSGQGNGYEIMIYGPVINPVIYLDNKPVQVNIELSSTERLRIISNGATKTITVLTPSGAERDAFIYRDKEQSPFLTLGQHTDLTYGQIRFDFTTIERRSQPTWN